MSEVPKLRAFSLFCRVTHGALVKARSALNDFLEGDTIEAINL